MLAIVVLFWAGNSIVARAVHDQIPPFSLAFGRWMGALLILMPLAFRHIVADRAEIRRHWRIIGLLALTGIGMFNALLYSGLQYTTASNGLLIQAGIPALVLLLDFVFFRTRPRPIEVVGVTLALLGVFTIVFRADPAAFASLQFGKGDALVCCAVIVWAIYTSLLRLRPAIHPISFLATTFLIGAVVMLPFAAREWWTHPIIFTPAVCLAIAYVATFPSLIAYLLYNRAVGILGAGAAGQMISLQPLFGALLAAAILSEPLHPYHLAGMALILIGIALPLISPAITGRFRSSP